MAAVMEWGVDDCLIDLFGPDAHKKISWIKGTHNETLEWLLSFSERDRFNIIRATFEGQGYFLVDVAEPGDCAIGNFQMGLDLGFRFPNPWYAQMNDDCNFYIRMPACTRVVKPIGKIVVYRCRF